MNTATTNKIGKKYNRRNAANIRLDQDALELIATIESADGMMIFSYGWFLVFAIKSMATTTFGPYCNGG